jgi:hypothetical protein
MVAKPPSSMGLSEAELRSIERKTFVMVLLFWSPFYIYLAVAICLGWKI